MTTAARQAEADRVELVYYWALNQLGNAMAFDALDLWQEVPASQQAARSSSWLSAIIRLIFGFRAEAQELAIAYYRLVRALRTGSTVGQGDEQDGDTVSLESLRDAFEFVVDDIARETQGQGNLSFDENPYDVDEPELAPGDDNDTIEVETVIDIEDLIDASDEAALEEMSTVLDALGTQNLVDKVGQTKDEQGAQDAHSSAGNRQAAAAMRIMLNAARGLVYDLADTDLRVIGWVRYSQTGDPCGWCAMLISRGIAYRTRAQASGKSSKSKTVQAGDSREQDKYHDNCRCVAVPIFGLEQYGNPMFDQNRYYDALWTKHIKGKFSGDAALTRWRNYIRNGFPGETRAAPEAA